MKMEKRFLSKKKTGSKPAFLYPPLPDIKKGTLRNIIRQSGLTVDEFLSLI